MILVRHISGNISCERECESPRFLIASQGNFFYDTDSTKYGGLYFREMKGESDWTMFKTIESLSLGFQAKAIINNLTKLEKRAGNEKAVYFFSKNGLVIDCDFKGSITFTLDMREIYDFDDRGRIYDVREDKGCIIVEYKKYTDNQLESVNYARYLAIKTDIAGFEKIGVWKEKQYQEDNSRKSYPWKLYVYDALRLKCNRKSRIAIGFSSTSEDALSNAKKAFGDLPEEQNPLSTRSTIEQNIAYNCAVKSLNDLYIGTGGIEGFYAGLPWFFQVWTRDEAISLKALLELGEYDKAKKILFERIQLVGEDGRLPNRYPHAALSTADGTGWTFKRILDLIEGLEEKKEALEQYLSKYELEILKKQLGKSIAIHLSSHMEGGLIINKPNETWMDTSFNDSGREGARIEVQALWLSMLRLSNKVCRLLGEKEEHLELEKSTRQKIKEAFFENSILKDGKDDANLRPNIFLAYYIYPWLLEKEEWEAVFDNSLPKLWLPWGGLSTIQNDSPLFCSDYTGEDNRSYHRGDSWFFVNNIVAICFSTLNKAKYKEYIGKILDASTRDILYDGIIGRPSELSSASSQKAAASLFQLWSASTYIEMMYGLGLVK